MQRILDFKEETHMREIIAGTVEKSNIALGEKYMLSIKEAALYFNIGVKKLRRMAEDNEGDFAIFICSRYLIIRPKFEEYLLEMSRNNSVIDGKGGDFV